MILGTGRIYVAYFKTANNVSDIYLTHFDDQGKTFSSSVRVNDIKDDATADDTSPPVVKVASNGVYRLHKFIDRFLANLLL